ncbi:hypothetical protein BDR03DRAFT_1019088 [Suillus americanus]|nr:hypothetical protein BDR03DRAFT_1019088 [Suillus americanus]
MPNSPRSPRAPTKKPFGPARVIAGSHPAVMEPSQPTPKPLVQVPPVMPVVDILIPGLASTCICLKTTHSTLATSSTGLAPPGWTRGPGLRVCHASTARQRRSSAPPQIWDPRLLVRPLPPKHLAPPKLPLPPNPRPELVTQTRGRSKTITAIKPPAPAAASLPSSRLTVPAAAPSPAVPAAALGARVAEQDGELDTLQCLHEGLRHEIIDRHPSFPLPDTPANAASLLLDQPGPRTMSPPESALPPLIDLSMETLAPTTATPTFPDASAIEGLLFDYDQVVHPEDRDASADIVDPGDPSNLVPEYDSSNNMDVEMEVKVDESSEEVDMAT